MHELVVHTCTYNVYTCLLRVIQVLQLLDTLKLSGYSEAFRKEGINGDLLLALDDPTLQQDLGISSRLHRISIMRFINGKSSAKDILEMEETTDETRPETAQYLTPVGHHQTQSEETISP